VVGFFQVSHQNSICICVTLLEPAKSTDPTQNDGDSDTFTLTLVPSCLQFPCPIQSDLPENVLYIMCLMRQCCSHSNHDVALRNQSNFAVGSLYRKHAYGVLALMGCYHGIESVLYQHPTKEGRGWVAF